MKKISRRSFVKSSIGAGFGLALAHPNSKVLGANDDIRVAVVGINGRGGSHIGGFREIPGVRVAALCDIDDYVIRRRIAELEKDNAHQVTTYADVRNLLEDKNIDAITVATPNHWHSLITVWACQAGKDVYVEKPCSHNVFEGRQCVAASRKYDRIVQHGTQSRASSWAAKQIAAIQSGKYGKLLISKGYCCKPRWSIGYKPYEEIPGEVNFDLWLGPAPEQPFHRNLVHYNWHWFWDFGNGDMGNQGVHQMDIARWAIKGATLPKSVITMGGRYVDGPNYSDQGETPNMQLSVFDYGETKLVFETRGLVGKISDFPRIVDNEFFLEAGVIRKGKFFENGHGVGEDLGDVDYHINEGNIFENFINAVRNRNRENQHADILEGHYSSALCHLGNISYRLGWNYPFTMKTTALGESEVVTDALRTVLDNTQALGIDPLRSTYRLGPKLHFDHNTETFIHHPPANLMVSRFYRQPFVVPTAV
ncbi:MAG: Inositol 2-dehydrogenase [Verrucomicrobia subdivision 3 bacterium]|nr:Inositol 2-dehydrogenase [Limisphaerales bacterium]MCS1413478.1 Inositol 2-dehydrogenase [Limisphaerales bacterium]